MMGLIAAALAAVTAPGAAFCIAITEDKGDDVAILTAAGDILRRIPVGQWPHELEIDSSGRTLYATQFGITDYDSRLGTPGDHVSIIDLPSATEVGRIGMPDGRRAPHGVKLRPGTSELFVNTESGGDTMLVFDTESRSLLRQFPIPSGSHNHIFSPDGASLYIFSGAAGVTRFDSVSGTTLAHRKLTTPARGLRLTGAGLFVAGKGEVSLLNPMTLDILETFKAPVSGQLVYLEVLDDGTIIAPSLTDNGVVWFDKAGGRLIPTGKAALNARLAPDGTIYVTNVDDDHITHLDRTGTVIGQIGKDLHGPNAIGFAKCPAKDAAGETAERG